MKDNIWAEKYRPKEFVEIVIDDKTKNFVEAQIRNIREVPNFLFFGAPGTGKSTLARVIIGKLDCERLILNGSDERGIDTVRQKVKSFASTLSLNSKPKVILVEEADYLTKEAQTALRSMMETYSSNARFIFTLNYVEKILEPLKSRCCCLKFELPEKSKILARLIEICQNEKLEFEEQALSRIIDIKYPDIRSCINKIQELSNRRITLDIIKTEQEIQKQIYDAVKSKDFDTARRLWVENGLSFEELTNSFAEWFFKEDLKNKGDIFIELGETSYRLGSAINQEVVFSAQMIKIMRLL